jgi:hypothetical protein
MDLVARLPSLEDTALAVLHQNAERLEQSGTSAQKSAAAALLPAIQAELAARREAKRVELAARRAAKATGSTPRAKSAAKKPTTKGPATKGAASND